MRECREVEGVEPVHDALDDEYEGVGVFPTAVFVGVDGAREPQEGHDLSGENDQAHTGDETGDDRLRHRLDQDADPGNRHREQEDSRQQGGGEQALVAEQFDHHDRDQNAGLGRAADLEAARGEERDDRSADDDAHEALVRARAGGDRDHEAERQRDHRNREACRQVDVQIGPRIPRRHHPPDLRVQQCHQARHGLPPRGRRLCLLLWAAKYLFVPETISGPWRGGTIPPFGPFRSAEPVPCFRLRAEWLPFADHVLTTRKPTMRIPASILPVSILPVWILPVWILQFWILTAVLAALAHPAGAETRLLRFPDIHGDRVVFTYAGDLWSAATAGGTAVRLTSHPGLELFARFSPGRRRDRLHRAVRRG